MKAKDEDFQNKIENICSNLYGELQGPMFRVMFLMFTFEIQYKQRGEETSSEQTCGGLWELTHSQTLVVTLGSAVFDTSTLASFLSFLVPLHTSRGQYCCSKNGNQKVPIFLIGWFQFPYICHLSTLNFEF